MSRDVECESCGLKFIVLYYVKDRYYECPSCGGSIVLVFDDWKDGIES